MSWRVPAFRRAVVCGGILLSAFASFIAYILPTPKVGYNSVETQLKYRVQSDEKVSHNSLDFVMTEGNPDLCYQHTPLGFPDLSELKSDQKDPTYRTLALLCHNTYASIYSLTHKAPLMVFHVLNRKNLMSGKHVARETEFVPDPLVAKRPEFALSKDFRGTGYDRGHLMPAGDVAHSETAMKESFYMTNIAPQAPDFNRGLWQRLESDVRKLLQRGYVCNPVSEEQFDKLKPQDRCKASQLYPYSQKVNIEQLYITTGTLFHVSKKPKSVPQIGDPKSGVLGLFKNSNVAVPNYFYKIILEPRTGMSVAYLVQNTNDIGKADYHRFRIPLKQLEKQYSYTSYYSQLPSKQKFVKNFYITKNNENKVQTTGGKDGLLDHFLY